MFAMLENLGVRDDQFFRLIWRWLLARRCFIAGGRIVASGRGSKSAKTPRACAGGNAVAPALVC
jgi:hypothetical protein